jgi:hypothetical protein
VNFLKKGLLQDAEFAPQAPAHHRILCVVQWASRARPAAAQQFISAGIWQIAMNFNKLKSSF